MSDTYTLITEDGYEGKYVALVSFSDRRIIASGNDPGKVYEDADKVGYKSPLVFFVPHKNYIRM